MQTFQLNEYSNATQDPNENQVCVTMEQGLVWIKEYEKNDTRRGGNNL